MNRIHKDKYNCCGCTACENICSHKAITMVPDALGFLYPVIDDKKCVDCGLCENVCSFNSDYNKNKTFSTPFVFGIRHKDEIELSKSQSGGAFVALSDVILEQGGIVYGVGFTNHFRVTHKRAINKEERDEFRGSKYVQSDIRGVFSFVKEDLKKGNRVLFTGTPCQNAGLSSFIGEKLRENLFLIDLVCHGVPSPAIWKSYLAYIEKKHGEAVDVNFRNKKYGWGSHINTFEIKNHICLVANTFTRLFYSHIMLRQSCYNCPYTNLNRPSDITIGDFWGWTKKRTEFNDKKGVSLVLINTQKGKQLFELSKENIHFIESNTNECLQPQLQYPSSPHPKRGQFESDFSQYGFLYVAKKYGDLGLRYQVRFFSDKIKSILKKMVSTILIRK